MHLAKRFYDMALESNKDAYLPVVLVLFRLEFENIFKRLLSISFSSNNDKPSNINDLNSSWDIYLMVLLIGLISVLYTIRRQRLALRQPPVQFPVQ